MSLLVKWREERAAGKTGSMHTEVGGRVATGDGKMAESRELSARRSQ